ncbi:hypothetical protein PGTUg99_000544 [Puccinia graminis f. sp. tritici]|uniref:Uncharacterized protein n=1 Tax=Puccinia graminis f. sp. tritici TaxID=56615 RepID=A0A5B0P7N5_PUCGR|nr:hypothetical protein PGTUg99_000544 [Puccinia graminis f. sp. tritici]
MAPRGNQELREADVQWGSAKTKVLQKEIFKEWGVATPTRFAKVTLSTSCYSYGSRADAQQKKAKFQPKTTLQLDTKLQQWRAELAHLYRFLFESSEGSDAESNLDFCPEGINSSSDSDSGDLASDFDDCLKGCNAINSNTIFNNSVSMEILRSVIETIHLPCGSITYQSPLIQKPSSKRQTLEKRPEKLEAAIRNNALDSLLAPNQSPLHPFIYYLKGVIQLQHHSINQADMDRAAAEANQQLDAKRIAQLEDALMLMLVKIEPEHATPASDKHQSRSAAVQIVQWTQLWATHDDDKIRIVGTLICETNTQAFYAASVEKFIGQGWTGFKEKLIAFALPPMWHTNL